MSPTEFDLRNALSDGEGDGVDPDRIVHLGRTRRAQRRSRVLNTTAAVVVAAGVAAGGAFIAHTGSSDGGGGSAAGSAADVRRSQATDLPAQAPSAPHAGGVGRPVAGDSKCPGSFPALMLPGGGSPGQFGSSGPIFAEPPVTLLVCAYGAPTATGAPAQLTLTGAQATALADSLENASKVRTVYPCPSGIEVKQNRLAIIATAAGGTILRTVTTEVAASQCNMQATNGTAIRYQWQPPADLQNVLLALTPRTVPAEPPDTSGKIIKSPAR